MDIFVQQAVFADEAYTPNFMSGDWLTAEYEQNLLDRIVSSNVLPVLGAEVVDEVAAPTVPGRLAY